MLPLIGARVFHMLPYPSVSSICFAICPMDLEGFFDRPLDLQGAKGKWAPQFIESLIKVTLAFLDIDIRVKHRRAFRGICHD